MQFSKLTTSDIEKAMKRVEDAQEHLESMREAYAAQQFPLKVRDVVTVYKRKFNTTTGETEDYVVRGVRATELNDDFYNGNMELPKSAWVAYIRPAKDSHSINSRTYSQQQYLSDLKAAKDLANAKN